MNEELKKQAAERAIEFVRDGQIIGLGTGSTTRFAIEGLGRRVKQGLKITGVPTSIDSERMARDLSIPLADLNDVTRIDIDIDGADEIDGDFNMIKGGGGALTREKLVALATERVIIVVDESKRVERLGREWPVPVEVLPFAWSMSARLLTELGSTPRLREKDGTVFVTDNGNYILDCAFGLIADAPALEKSIKQLPGVVEVGLFIGLCHTLVIGKGGRVEVEERPA